MRFIMYSLRDFLSPYTPTPPLLADDDLESLHLIFKNKIAIWWLKCRYEIIKGGVGCREKGVFIAMDSSFSSSQTHLKQHVRGGFCSSIKWCLLCIHCGFFFLLIPPTTLYSLTKIQEISIRLSKVVGWWMAEGVYVAMGIYIFIQPNTALSDTSGCAVLW